MIPLCWYPGCDAELHLDDGRWTCPQGHRLRGMSRWMSDHIDLMSTDPARIQRYFGDLT